MARRSPDSEIQVTREAALPSAAGSPVGRHPFYGPDGRPDARVAATWLCNLILMAGGTTSTAFECGKLLALEIEQTPEKFRTMPSENSQLSCEAERSHD